MIEPKQWDKLCELVGFTSYQYTWHDRQNGPEFEGCDWTDTKYVYPDGLKHDVPPSKDVNTLFQWIWPKLSEEQKGDVLFTSGEKPHLVYRLQREQNLDVFNALAQEIYRVITNGTK